MNITSNAGKGTDGKRRIAATAGMSDDQFDKWVKAHGGVPVTGALWAKLAKHGIFPELPPRKMASRAA